MLEIVPEEGAGAVEGFHGRVKVPAKRHEFRDRTRASEETAQKGAHSNITPRVQRIEKRIRKVELRGIGNASNHQKGKSMCGSHTRHTSAFHIDRSGAAGIVE